MILNVTEEQKKVIEERGHTVIEFKKWFYDIIDRFHKEITDIWNAVIFFLQDVYERYVIPCIEKISDAITECGYIIGEFFKSEEKWFYIKNEKYPFIRSLGKKYQPNISKRVIYHRCRDRC